MRAQGRLSRCRTEANPVGASVKVGTVHFPWTLPSCRGRWVIRPAQLRLHDRDLGALQGARFFQTAEPACNRARIEGC